MSPGYATYFRVSIINPHCLFTVVLTFLNIILQYAALTHLLSLTHIMNIMILSLWRFCYYYFYIIIFKFECAKLIGQYNTIHIQERYFEGEDVGDISLNFLRQLQNKKFFLHKVGPYSNLIFSNYLFPSSELHFCGFPYIQNKFIFIFNPFNNSCL